MATISKIASEVRKYALSLPEAWEDFPWEHQVCKVRKKIFLFCDNSGNKELRITVKLPESGMDVLEWPNAEMTGYGLGKAGWVSITFAPKDKPKLEILKAWTLESYKAVAPAKLAKQV